jgi:4-aminobutyrate aminotransferase-like enzyme
MPISACIASRETMERAWGSGSTGEARHTFTFLGHPLSCAAACAAIEAIHHDRLVVRAREIGEALLGDLTKLGGKHRDAIAEVRGRGLMIGIEFRDRARVWPVVVTALQRGLIILPAGDAGNVIEIVPPYVIEPEQCVFLVETLESCLAATA